MACLLILVYQQYAVVATALSLDDHRPLPLHVLMPRPKTQQQQQQQALNGVVPLPVVGRRAYGARWLHLLVARLDSHTQVLQKHEH